MWSRSVLWRRVENFVTLSRISLSLFLFFLFSIFLFKCILIRFLRARKLTDVRSTFYRWRERYLRHLRRFQPDCDRRVRLFRRPVHARAFKGTNFVWRGRETSARERTTADTDDLLGRVVLAHENYDEESTWSGYSWQILTRYSPPMFE